MPFTPFHMGPALLIKCAGGRHFSVLVFGIAQVAMDIEPLVGMLRDADVLHGWSHTYVGATVIGLLSMVFAPALCRPILRRWNRELERHHASWLRSPEPIGSLASAAGAFLGTYSHVALDSIMHADIRPFSPWSPSNPLQGYISIYALHFGCFLSGILGVAAWLAAGAWRKARRNES